MQWQVVYSALQYIHRLLTSSASLGGRLASSVVFRYICALAEQRWGPAMLRQLLVGIGQADHSAVVQRPPQELQPGGQALACIVLRLSSGTYQGNAMAN